MRRHGNGFLPQRWRTAKASTTVLAVVHNVTAATRLLDVLPIIARDQRLEIFFTCPGSSAFTSGTEEYLIDRGIRPISWKEAIRRQFGLAISASYGGDLHKIKAPLVVIPHGMG